MTVPTAEPFGRSRRRGLVWVAGLIVALGAGVATAHGLYGVATAARVPAGIAWLYPLITDGLALVAYAATARLSDRGRGYAWTVVVLAAGLSGIAQASYLAGGVTGEPPAALQFGVGAWPAVAAAIVAHLLHLLGPDALTPTRQLAPEAAPDRLPVPADPLPIADAGTSTASSARNAVPVPVAIDPAAGTPRTDDAPAAVPVRRTDDGDPTRGGTARRRRRPKYTDAEVLARLAGRTAPMAVRAAASEFACGPDRARRLLARAGLLAASAGPPPGEQPSAEPSAGRPPAADTADQSASDEPAEPAIQTERRALHVVHGTPDQPRDDR